MRVNLEVTRQQRVVTVARAIITVTVISAYSVLVFSCPDGTSEVRYASACREFGLVFPVYLSDFNSFIRVAFGNLKLRDAWRHSSSVRRR